MGAGMDKIIPGLFVGSIRDSRDTEQIKKNNITHILTIYEDPRQGNIENIKYKCFKASDHHTQDIKQFFEDAIDFIHDARLNNGNVLVHCLAGVSRSTTIAISYIMTITELPWYDSLNACRAARNQTNPNFGFQRQLQNFEYTTLKTTRENLYRKYGIYEKTQDLLHCKNLLDIYHEKHKITTDTTSNTEPGNRLNCNPANTYPLPFNAYNLDEEHPVNPNDIKVNEIDKPLSPTNQLDFNEEEANKEKEKIVEKIFG